MVICAMLHSNAERYTDHRQECPRDKKHNRYSDQMTKQ